MKAGPILTALATGMGALTAHAADIAMTRIPSGFYKPFFKPAPAKGQAPATPAPVLVPAFRMDVRPVTNAQFRDFLRTEQGWRKSNARPVFVDRRYLSKWTGDLQFPAGAENEPVTNVSWFAAQAFCKARGLRLPTSEQWEYTLSRDGAEREEMNRRSLEWFAKPNSPRLEPVGRDKANAYGLHNMVGLVWEWTLDYNAYSTGTEQRNTSSRNDAEFCGAGASGVADPADYPAFMRYAMRSSLKATYTTDNVGFRCAGE